MAFVVKVHSIGEAVSCFKTLALQCGYRIAEEPIRAIEVDPCKVMQTQSKLCTCWRIVFPLLPEGDGEKRISLSGISSDIDVIVLPNGRVFYYPASAEELNEIVQYDKPELAWNEIGLRGKQGSLASRRELTEDEINLIFQEQKRRLSTESDFKQRNLDETWGVVDGDLPDLNDIR